jgi:hypothetical protein
LTDDLVERLVKFLRETEEPEGTDSGAITQSKLYAVLDASYKPTHPRSEPLRRYLEAQGVSEVLQSSPNIRCHPGLLCSDENEKGERVLVEPCPVMLAPLVKLDEELVGLHAVYLTEEGRRAPLPKPEKTWIAGKFREQIAQTGAVVQLFAPARLLSITLGVENGWAIAVATGHPVWVSPSDALLETLLLPGWVREVVCWVAPAASRLLADGTFRSPALLAAQRLVRRMRNQGRAAQLILPKESEGRSLAWSEVYRQQGRTGFPTVHPSPHPLPSARRLSLEPSSGEPAARADRSR